MMKSLQSNIAKNRIKITQEYLCPDSVLSLARKLAMQKIKDSLEMQANSIAEREKVQVESIQTLRLREKTLLKCQNLLEQLQGQTSIELENELQRTYDRYISTYTNVRRNVESKTKVPSFSFSGIRA